MESKLKGWHSRGYLPHFDGGEVVQFVTFRLGDSLPAGRIEKWKKELKLGNESDIELELYKKIEKYLDKGYGACWLKDKRIAYLVQGTLQHFNDRKYRLYAWVIMPNHVHLLLKPYKGFSLSEIIHSIKSYTAKAANKTLGISGEFWQRDYFDRYIRSLDHYWQVVSYIENNPVKAGLCKKPDEGEYSSAYR
jgi:REP element-mobilizing transposase RayT